MKKKNTDKVITTTTEQEFEHFKKLDKHGDPIPFDEDDELLEAEDELEAEEKRQRKTRKARLHYHGKYELLPEREARKQLRFYARRFVYKWAGYFTAVFGLPLAFLGVRYNAFFALFAILVAIPGIIWGVLGLLKLRGGALLFSFIALALNVVVVVASAIPMMQLLRHGQEILDLIMEYFTLLIKIR